MWSRIFKITLFVLIAIVLAAFINVVVTQASDTCPDSGGWIKIDSGDLSSYPVDGATDYCFKAGNHSTVSEIPSGGFGQEGPCKDGIQFCDLSHWSYFVPPNTNTPVYTNTPDVTDTPEVKNTPTIVTNTPTQVTNTPTAVTNTPDPTATPRLTNTLEPTITPTPQAPPTCVPENNPTGGQCSGGAG